MRFFTLCGAAALALAFTGCGQQSDTQPDADVLVSNDFETMAGWMPEPQSATLSREQAHSGHYSLKVDAAHEYSMGYSVPLGQLHGTRIKKIKVSAWAFATAPDANASFVVAVNPVAPETKPLLWEGLELGKSTVGKWREVSKELTLPENTTPNNTLVLYLWRTGGDKAVYLDDIRVALVP